MGFRKTISTYAYSWFPLLTAVLLLLGSDSWAAQPLKLLIPPQGNKPPHQIHYFPDLLELVLRKTEASDGPFTIEQYPHPISTERTLEELKHGRSINLVWAVANVRRERELLPVRISLLRELNNYRIFLIRKEDQAKFDKVKTLDDLRKFSAGLGSQWPDTETMRSNNLPVTTALYHSALFPMLTLKRFDYFPRGIYEVWNEAEHYRDQNISIEKNIMLYYQSPFYFFVSRKNPALADRLERGLKRAIADGSFDQLLQSIASFKRGMEELDKGNRLLFVLDPPLAPPPAGIIGRDTASPAAH